MAGKKERKFKVGDGVWILKVVFGSAKNRQPGIYKQQRPRVAGIVERIWGDNYYVRFKRSNGRETLQSLDERMIALMTRAEYRRKFGCWAEPVVEKSKAASAGGK